VRSNLLRLCFPALAGLLIGFCWGAEVVEANRAIDAYGGRSLIISGQVATIPKQKNNQQSFALSGISFNYSTSVIKSQIYVTTGSDISLEQGD
jgi:hypothetical protein